MKSLLSIITMVMCVGLLEAQEMYLKKETAKMDENWEVYNMYNYDENMNLQSIYMITQNEDTVISKFFVDGRIQMEIQPNLTMQFEYQGDSVMEYREQNDGSFLLSMVYFLNGAHEVVEMKMCDNNGNYIGSISLEWEFGNCIHSLNSIGGEEFMVYDEYVRNPFLNENKFFKRGFPGSYNQLTYGDFISAEYEMTIINTVNDFPTEIEFSDSNGNERTLYYEYFDPSGIADELYSRHVEILDVIFYNALGQQIQKPEQGFYIEKVITSRGSFTKKYFSM